MRGFVQGFIRDWFGELKDQMNEGIWDKRELSGSDNSYFKEMLKLEGTEYLPH